MNKRAEEQSEQLFEWESKYQDLETRAEQEAARFEDAEANRAREATKLKETLADTQRALDTLKRKYSEDVE